MMLMANAVFCRGIHKLLSRKALLKVGAPLLVLLLALTGYGITTMLQAAPFTASAEVEQGATTKATKFTDTTASSGQAVRFASNTANTAPPDANGYFTTQPVGSWS